MDKIKFVKIYGLERTGTNYLEWLLNNNTKNTHILKGGNVLGWKHEAPPKMIDWSGQDWDRKPVIPEIIEGYKESIKGKEWLIQDAFDADDIIYIVCVRDPYSLFYKSVSSIDILKWNDKNSVWLNFCMTHKRTMIVKHGDLIGDYRQVLERFSSEFEINMIDTYMQLDNRIGARQNIQDFLFDRDFYAEMKYLKLMTEEQKQIIRTNVSKSLMKHFEFVLY